MNLCILTNLTSSHFHGYQVPKDWLTSDSCYFYNVIFVSVSSKIQFLKKLRRSSKPIPENSKQEILYDFILGTCQYCLIHTACGLFLSSFTTLLVLDVSLSPSLSRPIPRHSYISILGTGYLLSRGLREILQCPEKAPTKACSLRRDFSLFPTNPNN